MDMPPFEQFELPDPGFIPSLRSREQEQLAAARVVRQRVVDPVDRAEILAALGLPAEMAGRGGSAV